MLLTQKRKKNLGCSANYKQKNDLEIIYTFTIKTEQTQKR